VDSQQLHADAAGAAVLPAAIGGTAGRRVQLCTCARDIRLLQMRRRRMCPFSHIRTLNQNEVRFSRMPIDRRVLLTYDSVVEWTGGGSTISSPYPACDSVPVSNVHSPRRQVRAPMRGCRIHDKGKPLVRVGRKAMDPRARIARLPNGSGPSGRTGTAFPAPELSRGQVDTTFPRVHWRSVASWCVLPPRRGLTRRGGVAETFWLDQKGSV
jgi:hypothetical protein